MNIYWTYDSVVEAINSHKISLIEFKVKDYAHYKNCKIVVREEQLPNSNNIFLIDIILTKDESEHFCFYDKFKEEYKLFYLGKKGSFTLKQLWDRIEIISIQ